MEPLQEELLNLKLNGGKDLFDDATKYCTEEVIPALDEGVTRWHMV